MLAEPEEYTAANVLSGSWAAAAGGLLLLAAALVPAAAPEPEQVPLTRLG